MRPAFRVTAPTGAFSGPGGLGLECTVVDQNGSESDVATIVVDDRDGLLEIPATGTKLQVEMGYEETELADMGEFEIETVTVVGWPRAMVISATGVSMTGKMKERRTQDYHDKSVSDVISDIAKRHGLAARVPSSIGSRKYDYLAQTQESDMHFFTRLARDNDAVAKVARGRLLFTPRGKGESGTGQSVSSVTLTYGVDIKYYEAQLKSRPAHGRTRAPYHRVENGETKDEATGLPPGISIVDFNDAATGVQQALLATGAAATFQVPSYQPDGKEQAKRTAEAKQGAQDRLTGELDLIIIGNPAVMAESPINVVGVRYGVDGEWNVTKVQHTIDTSGFESIIHAEFKG